jgi:hypothetical protein
MERARLAWVWVGLFCVAGCPAPSSSETGEAESKGQGSDDDDGDNGDGETGDGSGSASLSGGSNATMSSTSGDDTATGGPSDESGDEGQSFVVPPDGGGANECDPQDQDCPEGQKCTAWANDGGTFWNANKCVDVGGAGVAGDPCMVEGSGVSGVDDCDVGFICMNTNEENIGTCIEFCQGDAEDCDPDYVCAIYNDGVLPICLLGCDPLQQNCPPMQACIDTPNASFICFNDASGETGAAGDPCPPADGENSCDPGMWCGPGYSGCASVNCCTPYCDLSDDDCTGANQCISFFGDGDAPPGFEEVGVCIVPS